MKATALLVLALAACAEPDARTALIVDTLVAGDRDLVGARGDAVAARYALMATGAQPFLRGTAALFYRDRSRELGEGPVVHGAGAELVPLYGDLHVENVGASFDDVGMLLDCVDYDATLRGPFDWDVRRAALGLAVAVAATGRGEAVQSRAAAALGTAYLAALDAAIAGAPGGPLRAADVGAIAAREMATADRQRAAREDLTRYTEVVDGRRRLLRGPEMGEPPAPFQGDFATAIAGWRQSRRGGPGATGPLGDDARYAVKDAGVRLGMGVASLPNLRFWVLLEGAPGEADDFIVELKEERDPPQPIAWLDRGPRPPGNAARVVAGMLLLEPSATEDPDLGEVTWQGVPFLVRQVTRGRRSLDVADLTADVASGRFGDDDLAALGTALGRLLGAGHARGGAAVEIRRAAGDALGFAATTADEALRDRRQLDDDLVRFRAALATRGPLLGARP